MKDQLTQALFESVGAMQIFIDERHIERKDILTVTENIKGFRLWFYF